jgi:hypothetical protein
MSLVCGLPLQVLSLALQASSSHESLSSVSSFLHLQQQHLFMTISYHTLTTWNFKVSFRQLCNPKLHQHVSG